MFPKKSLPYLFAGTFAFSGCVSDWHQKNLPVPPGKAVLGADWYVDSARRLVWLEQGWSRGDSDWFYTTTQGSELMPYSYFLALEQENSAELFRDVRNMQKYRYLPQSPNPTNPDALPVGFVKDGEAFGLTCAACHTTQINYRGTAMRIDGGPAMADFEGFLAEMTAALKKTEKDEAKFNRFAARVLGSRADESRRNELRVSLGEVAAERSAYDRTNASNNHYGFARLDAFGRIFNNALTLVDKRNGVVPNAPVSYPHLWDAPHEDYVQWTRVSSNDGIGSLARNVGEVVGVFAKIHPGNPPPSPFGYKSSVRLRNLLALEARLKTLESPRWPENILGRLDVNLVRQGKPLYDTHCRSCHNDIVRDDPNRRVATVGTPISELKTDPLTAENILKGQGRTGYLEGTREFIVNGKRFGPQAPAVQIVGNTVLRTIAGQLTQVRPVQGAGNLLQVKSSFLNGTIDARKMMSRADEGPRLQYKARPLNGIWATAPYLHNGSVANLYELMLPVEKRSLKFAVGRREFDPKNVGFATTQVPGAFVFDTSLESNHNTGHTYGAHFSEPERLAVLEYLKSI